MIRVGPSGANGGVVPFDDGPVCIGEVGPRECRPPIVATTTHPVRGPPTLAPRVAPGAAQESRTPLLAHSPRAIARAGAVEEVGPGIAADPLLPRVAGRAPKVIAVMPRAAPVPRPFATPGAAATAAPPAARVWRSGAGVPSPPPARRAAAAKTRIMAPRRGSLVTGRGVVVASRVAPLAFTPPCTTPVRGALPRPPPA